MMGGQRREDTGVAPYVQDPTTVGTASLDGLEDRKKEAPLLER
jgi:hypothetical protein